MVWVCHKAGHYSEQGKAFHFHMRRLQVDITRFHGNEQIVFLIHVHPLDHAVAEEVFEGPLWLIPGEQRYVYGRQKFHLPLLHDDQWATQTPGIGGDDYTLCVCMVIYRDEFPDLPQPSQVAHALEESMRMAMHPDEGTIEEDEEGIVASMDFLSRQGLGALNAEGETDLIQWYFFLFG